MKHIKHLLSGLLALLAVASGGFSARANDLATGGELSIVPAPPSPEPPRAFKRRVAPLGADPDTPRLFDGAGPGVSTIGPGGTYPSLSAALGDLSNSTLTGGDWNFLVLGDLLETADSYLSNLSSDGSKAILRPAPGTHPSITFTQSQNAYAHIWIRGMENASVSNFVIDGCNTPGGTTKDFRIASPAGTLGAYPIVVYGDVRDFAIRNTVVESGRDVSGQYVYAGILTLGLMSGITPTVELFPSNPLYENCTFLGDKNAVVVGLAFSANGTAGVALPSGTTNAVLRGCEIYGGQAAVEIFHVKSLTIEDNVLAASHIQTGTRIAGIMGISTASSPNADNMRIDILRNRFVKVNAPLNNAGFALHGILFDIAGTGQTYNICNNMIGGVRLTNTGGTLAAQRIGGICVSRGTNATVTVLHNSVDLVASAGDYPALTSATAFAFGLTNPSFTGSVAVRNNILRNGQPGGSVLNIGTSGAVLDSNNNVFFSQSGIVARLGGVNRLSLAQWTAASNGQDNSSIWQDPTVAVDAGLGVWASATGANSNLHFTEFPGNPYLVPKMEGVVGDDIDKEPRHAQTVRGADEFSGTPLVNIAPRVYIADPPVDRTVSHSVTSKEIWGYADDYDDSVQLVRYRLALETRYQPETGFNLDRGSQNYGPWMEANQNSENWATWSFSAPLEPGFNYIHVQAVDQDTSATSDYRVIRRRRPDGVGALCLTPFADAWGSRNVEGELQLAPRWRGLGFRHDATANWQTVAGDFTGDGLTDLMTITNNREAWLAINLGNQTFAEPAFLASGFFFDHAGGWFVYAGDFNGDKWCDLAQTTSEGVLWRSLNNGGTLEPSTDSGFRGYLHGPHLGFLTVVGDVDGDGRDDLINVNPSSQVHVMRGTASGFAPTEYRGAFGFHYDDGTPGELANGSGIVAGDFNGDGRADLADVTGFGDVWVSMSGDTQFASPSRWGWPGFFHAPQRELGWEVFAGDLDGDGRDDLLQVTEFGDVWVAYSNGVDGFSEPAKAASPGFHHAPQGPWQVYFGKLANEQ